MKNHYLVTLLFLVCTRLSAQAPAQPYIIMITMDDMNAYLGTYDMHPQVETPNLDALLSMGTVFTNAHCASPKCAPSRTSLITGKDVDYTQVYDNTSYQCQNFRKNFRYIYGNETVFTLPEYLKDSVGYYTYALGKTLHCYEAYSDFDTVTLDPCSKQFSWSNCFVYVEDEIIDPIGDAENEGIFLLKWARLDDTLIDYMEDDVTIDQAISFIDDFAASGTAITCGNPFFMALGIKKPHAPFYVPESFYNDNYLEDIYTTPYDKPYNEPYNADPYNGIVMPPQPVPRWSDYDSLGYMGQLFASTNEAEQFDAFGGDLPLLPEIEAGISDSERIEILNESMRANALMAYLAGVKFLDFEIGRFLDALEAHPDIYNNTVIIISSDHGFTHGQKRHWGKFSLWEGDMRIPMAFIDLRNPVGQVCGKSVSNIDIYPTVLDMLDVPEPVFPDGSRYLDGYSLMPLINNPATPWERPVLGGVRTKNSGGTLNDGSCFTQYSVRNNRFHYIKYTTNNAPPLLTCDVAASQTEEELYDIGDNRQTDPNEWNNLIDDTEYAPVLDYMRQFVKDSTHYKEKMFAVNIINTNTLPCFIKNTGKIKLQAQLYNVSGTLLTGAGYTFTWSNSLTAAVATGKNYTFNMVTIPPATYSANDHILFYLKVTNASGDLVAFNTRTYYINNANTPNATFTLLNDVTELSTSINAYTLTGSYTNTYWNFGDGIQSEEFLPDTHYYTAPGYYTVRNYIQYGNGCQKYITRYANLLREGAPEFAFAIYPNPTSDQVTLAMPEAMDNVQLTAYNVLGEVIYRTHLSRAEQTISLDVSSWSAGSYFIEVRDAKRYGVNTLEVVR